MVLYVVPCCYMLLYVVLCCYMWFYVVICYCMLLFVFISYNMLLYVVICCYMWFYVVICCNLLPGVHKKIYSSFWFIFLATNMLKGLDLFYLKCEIHSSVCSCSTKTFLYDIRELRNKQIIKISWDWAGAQPGWVHNASWP